jgi:hypothetical protein
MEQGQSEAAGAQRFRNPEKLKALNQPSTSSVYRQRGCNRAEELCLRRNAAQTAGRDTGYAGDAWNDARLVRRE